MSRAIIVCSLGLALATAAVGARAAEEPKQHSLELAPIVIDSQDGTGSTIGLQFALSGDLLPAAKPAAAAPSDNFEEPERVLIKQYNVHYEAKGVVTADSERNPLNYIDAIVDARILRNSPSGTFIGGAFLRYETDQSMDNRQSEYGVRGT